MRQHRLAYSVVGSVVAASALIGCKHPEVTAVPLSRWNCHEPKGIPFYLPKPLLIVAKNFRYVDEATTGLTDSAPIPGYFDDQARYADLNSRATFQRVEGTGTSVQAVDQPGTTTTITPPATAAAISSRQHYSTNGPTVTPAAAPRDALAPETYYTYHIVFVPDLSQKYGLRIKGGVGEIRAAMNLVNGWQFTGLGPYYMKDSSSAQNALAGGIAANLAASGAANVISSVGSLAKELRARDVDGRREVEAVDVKETFELLKGLQPVRLEGFAEIHILEPKLDPVDGTVSWVPVTDLSFSRDYFGLMNLTGTGRTLMQPRSVDGSRRSLDESQKEKPDEKKHETRSPEVVPRTGTRESPTAPPMSMNQNVLMAPPAAPMIVPAELPRKKPLGLFGHLFGSRKKRRPLVATHTLEQLEDTQGRVIAPHVPIPTGTVPITGTSMPGAGATPHTGAAGPGWLPPGQSLQSSAPQD
jgi:hypothetical protein